MAVDPAVLGERAAGLTLPVFAAPLRATAPLRVRGLAAGLTGFLFATGAAVRPDAALPPAPAVFRDDALRAVPLRAASLGLAAADDLRAGFACFLTMIVLVSTVPPSPEAAGRRGGPRRRQFNVGASRKTSNYNSGPACALSPRVRASRSSGVSRSSGWARRTASPRRSSWWRQRPAAASTWVCACSADSP